MITVDFKRLELKPGDRILDIGCGSGRHLAEAARWKDVVAIGADLRYPDVLQARERLRFHQELGEHGGGPSACLTASVTDLPFDDDAFDLVICSEVLEHIPDHQTAVGELVRILKPGCHLVVSVPRWLPERICWALSRDYHAANDGHVRIYKARELTRMIEEAGLRCWAGHHAHALHSPYWWLKCLVGPTRQDSALVNLYHRLLVWDMMKRPKATRAAEEFLNPLIGKSVVLYFRKDG
ncbi:MAG: methyltransferase domain-containing protein [Proteobacteria bacterium]|nr:methyltransferase domain-containing protein [Pseudomonadota bacterium]